MKAIRVHTPGGPDALVYEDAPDPVPKAGEALVRLEAIGVNFIDVYFRSGQYKSAALPFTPGQEGAGTVVALGPDASGVAVGDRVAYTGVQGSYAELSAVPADRLVRLPDGVSTRDGAALMLQGMTAHYLATSTFPLERGQTCLVHAAAGGVGLLLCQIAKRRGARVIGTVSTEEKAVLARQAGADDVIQYTRQDFVAEVQRLTSGAGVQVVYDSVGRTTFDGSLRSLARRGMLVLFGQSSGAVEPLDPQRLSAGGSLFLTRPSLFHYMATRDELLGRANDLFGWLRDGSLSVRIGAEFPLAQAADAHRALEGRQTSGKVMLL
ncbi:MAG: quinone oxidoreductase [Candidatus Limnocylindrales bacterium]